MGAASHGDAVQSNASSTERPNGLRCHAARLTEVLQREDPLGAQLDPALALTGSSVQATPITEIAWYSEDALPFALPIVSHRQTEPLSVINRV